MQSANIANKFGLCFHHLGLAVDRPQTAIIFLEGLGYKIGRDTFDPQQNVNLFLCEHAAMPSVEVIYPAEGKGPLDRLLKQHRDGLVYHMCYSTFNPEASLGAMDRESDLHVLCVSPPRAAILFGGKPVSFYIVSNVGLIEIIDQSGRLLA
jgi:methylmalonyl-CoA/ethylmalonyl-CoA epimerase